MTDKNLMVLTNPVAETGESGDGYGSVNLNSLSRASKLANDAFATVEEVKDVPDDLASLREAVNKLSDAVGVLADELYQVGVGVREGRIAVVDLTE
jgi:hypothetical protein